MISGKWCRFDLIIHVPKTRMSVEGSIQGGYVCCAVTVFTDVRIVMERQTCLIFKFSSIYDRPTLSKSPARSLLPIRISLCPRNKFLPDKASLKNEPTTIFLQPSETIRLRCTVS
ncbi:hypothetical protein CDAR_438721 [Caerostris darwini]|uniref:Uncharacterized protein n=1 Tax=Caerostris darwini TaxID=1538125 RepID=A0AAV4X3P2_9ARAC|nr:hypothetical protein CDAR_438721 [Caerostris darwini]